MTNKRNWKQNLLGGGNMNSEPAKDHLQHLPFAYSNKGRLFVLKIRQQCNMTWPSGYYNSLTLPFCRRSIDLRNTSPIFSVFVVQVFSDNRSTHVDWFMIRLVWAWEGPTVGLALLYCYFSYFPWLCGISHSQSHVLSIIWCCSHGLIFFLTWLL